LRAKTTRATKVIEKLGECWNERITQEEYVDK